MHELHKNEQYFFDNSTLSHLSSFLDSYDKIAFLCAPILAKVVSTNKKHVTVLDIDDRFSNVPGYLNWSIYRPEKLPQSFDIIICDPPFYKISLSQLFKAIRILSHFNFDQQLLISYLHRRSNDIISTFSPFHLEPTGYFPGHATVKNDESKVEFFGNLGKEKHKSLRTLS